MKRNFINRFWFGPNGLRKYTVFNADSVTIKENNKNSNIMGLIILPSAATLRELIR